MRIGVDLGGTNIKVGAVDEKGSILGKSVRPTLVDQGADGIIQDIIKQIEELLEKLHIKKEEIQSIGIGVPGLVKKGTGQVIYLPNLFLKDVALGQRIEEDFHISTFVSNDAAAAALGEKIAGSTQGISNSVFITLGTGVGGGVIINDQVYSGGHGWGAEIGHIYVGENFYDCNCGNNGCLETFASATAMITYVKKRWGEGVKNTLILEKVQGDLERIDAKVIVDSAKEGDPLALEVMNRFIRYLAIAIVNLYNILDPKRIAIGGGISKAGDFILTPLREEVNKRVFTKEVSYGDIVLAELGNDAGMIGAAFLEQYQA